jgi:hypothetical protein
VETLKDKKRKFWIEVNERVKAEKKDDYKEDAKNVESNEPKETKQMSEDEEGK